MFGSNTPPVRTNPPTRIEIGAFADLTCGIGMPREEDGSF